jgi:hypothetical protein
LGQPRQRHSSPGLEIISYLCTVKQKKYGQRETRIQVFFQRRD